MFPLQEGVYTIGRDPGCDIHIDSLAIEPQHARLLCKAEQCILHDGKHDNHTFLNHRPIDEHVLQNNDQIRVGKHVLSFRNDDIATAPGQTSISIDALPTKPADHIEEQPQPHTVRNGWLQVMNGKMLGKTFRLQSGLTDLGKLGMLPALIALRSTGYYISKLADDDMLSVADKEIGDKSHPLRDGDVIKLGKVTLQFHLQA